MNIMEDRRHSRRIKVTLNLVVSSLFIQDNEGISIESPIVVKDISRTGLGFVSKSILPLNYYFNASLNIGDESSVLYSVVKIVRCEALENDVYSYGCEFVGMAPVLGYIFDELENNND